MGGGENLDDELVTEHDADTIGDALIELALLDGVSFTANREEREGSILTTART